VAKVLSLFSGSLASRVATRLVEEHPDVDSICLLHFRSPFAKEPESLRQLVREEWPGAPLRTQSLKREYRRLVDCQRGEAFRLADSCLSCRRLQLGRAVRYMERVGADYLVTGDVLGENGIGRRNLTGLTEAFGLAGKILRPLCSEEPGSVGGGLSEWTTIPPGRSRRPEGVVESLARDLGMVTEDPMGCRNRCKLTLPGFGDRVARLFHETCFTLNELSLLDFPWYYEVRPDTKIVVTVEDQEKRELQNLFLPEDVRVYPAAPHGPMTLVRMPWRARDSRGMEEVIRLAARITTTHLGCSAAAPVPVYYRFEDENERHLVNVLPFSSTEEIALLDGVDVVPLRGSVVAVTP
jgi:tRNA-specific 2-thiouridylase